MASALLVSSSLPFFLLGYVLFLNTLDVANSFRFPSLSSPSARRAALKASPLTEVALASYPYEFRPDESTAAKRFLQEITKKQASTAFEELARVYGDTCALEMVKIQPIALTVNSDYFEPTLEVWAEQFGEDAAKAMVARNPALLLLNPKKAEVDAWGAMGWSFVIWATRPILSKLLMAGFLFYQDNAVITSEEGIPEWIQNAHGGFGF